MVISKGELFSQEYIGARPVRVVIKLARHVRTRARDGRIDYEDEAFAALRRIVPEAVVVPYFDEGEELPVLNTDPFNRYFAIEVADPEQAAALARRLQSAEMVEVAYVESGPAPPPVNPDDPRRKEQGYLDAQPVGIDAAWAWSLTDGGGIGFVDVEQGWTLDHEDLAAAGITLISGVNHDWHGHGTSVLGEVVGVDNAIGGIGIAPGASARVVSQWRTVSVSKADYNTATAILSAGQVMNAGDVLLIEAQMDNFLPVEVETVVFDAIRQVVGTGIVVVEAGGNALSDLDAYRDGINRLVLNRQSTDFTDSGAIMVGAGTSTAPHFRMGSSNHGSRIDCYAWGEHVVTSGDGHRGTSTIGYTAKFGGTSSASAIVAGAAILLQAWRKQSGGLLFTPQEMRARLSAPAVNTASANPAVDRIGVMPNLRAIITAEQARHVPLKPSYFRRLCILFGLVGDSPGMTWVPGKKPVRSTRIGAGGWSRGHDAI